MITLARIINKIFSIIDDIKHNAYIKSCMENGLQIGENTIIRNNVSFGSEPFLVQVGNNTRIASGTTFVTHSGATMNIREIEGYETVRNFGRIKIGNNCAIGSNCVILQNVEIGDNCIIGANSVISESVPDNTVFAGNPAKYICEIEDYADILKKTSLGYPIELEQDRKQLLDFLKQNLPHTYKPVRRA